MLAPHAVRVWEDLAAVDPNGAAGKIAQLSDADAIALHRALFTTRVPDTAVAEADPFPSKADAATLANPVVAPSGDAKVKASANVRDVENVGQGGAPPAKRAMPKRARNGRSPGLAARPR